jgi:hypothetical protein
MIDMKVAEHMYRNDAAFHALVDGIRDILRNMHLTPYEVRQAAAFAAYHHEMEHPHPYGGGYTLDLKIDGTGGGR